MRGRRTRTVCAYEMLHRHVFTSKAIPQALSLMITLHNHTVLKRKSLLGFETANIYELLGILGKYTYARAIMSDWHQAKVQKPLLFTLPNFCGGLKLDLTLPPELLLSK